VFSSEIWRALSRSLGLSQREAQIVPALLDDEKESAIARRLGISRHTVHTYTERLYRKIGVTSRVGVVRRVFIEYLFLAKISNRFRSR
jgi:DNA-binding CsgD family transcriptional regulator